MASEQVDAVNTLRAAVRSLRRFFTFGGRDDIISYAIGSQTGKTEEFLEASVATMTDSSGASVDAGNLDRDVIENIMDITMDNSEGAFFICDILTNENLLSRFDVDISADGAQYDGIENYVIFHTEYDDVSGNSSLPFLGTDSISDMCQTETFDEAMRPLGVFTPPVINQAGFVKAPDRYDSPSLGIIEFPNLQFGLPMRNTAATSIFINSIPAHELSRCVPFLSIRFQSVTPPIIGERTKQLSILRFLGMSRDNDPNDGIGMRDAIPRTLYEEFSTLVAINAASDAQEFESTLSSAGMELFTSPQTLVNADINSKDSAGDPAFGGLGGGVLNPFRPLATLESFKVSIEGTGQEFIAHKTAILTFMLHDRSRMRDIAPILAADLFGIMSLVVEYGWSHPDSDLSSANPLGQLIGAMRFRGSFNVVSSNFQIQEDGQVRVTVLMATRGAQDAKNTPIGTGHAVPLGIFKPMLLNFMAKRLTEETGEDSVTLRETRKKMNMQMNNINSASTVVSRDIFDKFLALIKPSYDDAGAVIEPDPKDFVTLIELLIGKDGTEGELADSDLFLSKEIKGRLDSFKAPKATEAKPSPPEVIDAFLPGQEGAAPLPAIIEERISAAGGDIAPGGSYVSLGKIFAQFVGQPLAASAQYDEVQLMFYRFNQQAGAARSFRSIAQFMVPQQNFRLWMRAFQARSPGVSVSNFIAAFTRKFVHNAASMNYGLDFFYKRKADLASSQVSAEMKQTENKIVGDAIDIALRKIYADDGLGGEGTFMPPDIGVYFEAVPVQVIGTGVAGPAKQKDDSKVVLRIHIYDKKATPHGDALFLIAAMSDGEVASKIKSASEAASTQSAAASGEAVIPNGSSKDILLLAATNSILVKASESNDTDYETYLTNISANEIKGIIKSTVPSLTFGSQCNALKSMSMSSSTTGLLGDVLMLNTLIETVDSTQGAGAALDLEPMAVIPASVKVDLVGCPLIEHGQQFFIDAGTGTTADNVYISTGVTHTITAGDFTTSFSLTFCSSGTISSFRKVLASSLPRLKDIATG